MYRNLDQFVADTFNRLLKETGIKSTRSQRIYLRGLIYAYQYVRDGKFSIKVCDDLFLETDQEQSVIHGY